MPLRPSLAALLLAACAGPALDVPLYLRGLDPAARYTLRLFAPRADAAHYSPLPQLAHTFTVRPMSSRISRHRS